MYRIVVAESSKPQGGKVVDTLGWYNPGEEGEKRFSLDMAKYEDWVSKGAQPNDSVLRMVLTKEEKETRWPAPKSEKKVAKKEVDTSTDTTKETKVEKAEETAEKSEETPKEN